MSKRNNTNTAIEMNGVTITINQYLHGIEVKGNVNKRDDKWLKDNGFQFSERKGHYWVKFDNALYDKVMSHFKAKAKSKGKSTTTIAEAAPINLKGTFEKKEEKQMTVDEVFPIDDEPAAKKPKSTKKSTEKKSAPKKSETKKPETKKPETKKKTEKAEPATSPAPVPADIQPTDDLKEWKRQVINAVEAIVDSAIETLMKGATA